MNFLSGFIFYTLYYTNANEFNTVTNRFNKITNLFDAIVFILFVNPVFSLCFKAVRNSRQYEIQSMGILEVDWPSEGSYFLRTG